MDKPAWSDAATVEDIYYCYRILLMREPSQEDLDHWIARVAAEKLTYSRLAAYIRTSREFVVGKVGYSLNLLPLDDFELYVQVHDWDIGENLIETKVYEPHVTAFLKQHLQEGMTFVDVGANIGYFTFTAAAKVGKRGKVIAVECNPQNCNLIYLSLLRNGFDHVTVVPFAVGDTQKLMSFSWGFSNGFVTELSSDEEELFIVQAVTLDSLLKDEKRVDVVKIDIEGAEAKAWQGLRETIEEHHPVLLIEYFPALLERVSGVKGEDFLESVFASGYRAGVLRREQEMVTAQSTSEVLAEWEKERELVGDVAKTYLDLVFLPKIQEPRKLKIAWLSPLPPQKSGIANYSYWLIKALSLHVDIDLYYDGDVPLPELQEEFEVYPISEFPERRETYDDVIYHLGNHSGFHKKIYQLAWKFPATVVLHDYNLSAFMHDSFYLQAEWQLYDQALVNNNGEAEHKGLTGLVPQLRRNVNGLPMSYAVVNRSRKVVVHHRWVKNQFSNNDHVEVIPHFARINVSPTRDQIEKFKEKFSIKDTRFLISCLGFINRNKLPELQVRVVKELLAQGYPVHLLFAGETSPEVRALQAEVEASEYREHITFTGYLDEADYFNALFASDILINLRNPSMGEASGTLMHALAAAKPAIISDNNQYKEFPDKVCWKLTHDENEARLLCDYLTVLLSNKNVRTAMSENAANYVQSVFALDKVVPQWLRIIGK